MRDFLDAILVFIGAATLSNEEFEALTIEDEVYNSEVYEALLEIIDARELVSNTRTRLTAYFTARGVSVVETPAAKSNIYIGSGLCN